MKIKQDRDSYQGKSELLSPRDVLSLLTSNGLLQPAKFITGSVTIRPSPYRNHNFFVQSDNGPSYFLKQGITEATIASVRREAAFYESVSTSFLALKKYLPGFVCFLQEHCILVLDYVNGGRPLNQLPNRRMALQVFANLGAAMALLHGKSSFTNVRVDFRPSPMIARVGSMSPNDLKTISAAGVELIRTIQRFPDYEEVLTGIFERSDDRCLTHNDFKSGNCLVGKNPTPILIDWEFAAIGDPAWDVGCVFADVLSSWLLSMPLGSQVGVQRLPSLAGRPLEMLHPAIQSFCFAYLRGRHLCSDSVVPFLFRATKCAGLKLSQSAYEMCQSTTSLSAVELFFLQTSWNILKRPAEALVRLFGINLGDQRLENLVQD
jgi:Ser/Thr protein kinase RdoA (MazF antagonist)